MATKTLKQLEQEFYRADDELRKIKSKIGEKRSELEEHYDHLVIEELDRLFGEDERKIQLKRSDALEVLTTEKDRLAKSGTDAKFPLGTKLIEKRDRSLPWSQECNWEPTGKVGIYEIIHADSQHPERTYKKPIGTHVIRLLGKDGTPGKRYIVLHGNLPYGWFTEDPNLMPKVE